MRPLLAWFRRETEAAETSSTLECLRVILEQSLPWQANAEHVAQLRGFYTSVADHAKKSARSVERDDATGPARQFVRGIQAAVEQVLRGSTVHGSAVGALAVRMGEAYGLTPEECAWMELAGQVHDIVTLRAGELVVDSFVRVRRADRDMIRRRLHEAAIAVDAVVAYPELSVLLRGMFPAGGVSGVASMSAEILRVADAFCAMLEDRPYRGPLSPADALAALRNARRFDAGVVDLIHRVFEVDRRSRRSA